MALRTEVGTFSSELQQASTEIQEVTNKIASGIKNTDLQNIFRACFPDALQDIQKFQVIDGKPFVHIKTGDIDAEWLRDASVQMLPYVRFARENLGIRQLILGVINQQVRYIIRDSYANAFSLDAYARSQSRFDQTDRKLPGVFERKWEPDSLAHVIHLSYLYWKATGGDTSFADASWQEAMQLIVKTFHDQQRMDSEGEYFFNRLPAKLFHQENEIVPNHGRGVPTKKIGLIHATHRASDDAAKFPFNIPENLFAAQTLRELATITQNTFAVWEDGKKFAEDCDAFADTIGQAVENYGVFDHPKFGKVYAYEITGFEKDDDYPDKNKPLFMDDANIPGFLSLRFLGVKNNEVLENTIRFALTPGELGNPYFFANGIFAGVGSPHTAGSNVWPMGIALRGLSSDDVGEKKRCLEMLTYITTGDHRFNESVSTDGLRVTRSDFGMANSMTAELLLQLDESYPEILQAA